MKKLLLFALLLGIAVPSYATTYYTAKLCSGGGAAPNCTDANNGTSRATAELTIAAGLAHLASGDTLIIGDGTYDEQIVNMIPSGISVGSPTRITAENQLSVIIRPTAGIPGFGIVMFGCGLPLCSGVDPTRHFITFDGIDIDGSGFDSGGGGFCVCGDVGLPALDSYIVFQNGRIRNNTISPGGWLGGGNHHSILNSEITNNGTSTSSGCTTTPGDGKCGHGIYYAASDGIIDGNNIHDNGWYSIHVQGISGGNTICNNVVKGGEVGVGLFLNFGSPGDSDNNVLCNNIIYGVVAGPVDGGGSGVRIRYGSSNTKVYFNTIYGNSDYCIDVGDADTDNPGVRITNNICYSNGLGAINVGSSTTDIICTYNLGVSGGESSSDVCSTTASASNPLFVNAAIGDFHVSETSPALPPCGVNGTGVTTDKDGITRPNPPSCGAYEVPSGIDPLDPLSEDFESYAATSSIAGLNSGAGWTQSWVLSSGAITVETAGCSLSGKAFRQNTTNFDEAYRLFTAHTGSFSLFYKACVSTTSLGAQIRYRFLNEGGSGIAPVYFQANGNIEAADGTDLVTSFSANQAYQVEVNFDTANQPNKYRVKIDAGSYSAWFDDPNGFVSVAGFIFGSYATNAHTAWLDDISEDIPAGGTITNVTPLAGQVCTSGSTCPISWGSNGITGNVDVYYLVGGNQYLIASPDVTATPYAWTVNAPAGTTIKTRISQGGVSSDSGEFTVLGTKAVFTQ